MSEENKKPPWQQAMPSALEEMLCQPDGKLKMKKIACIAIAKKLEDDKNKINSKLRKNIVSMKSLVEEQTLLKRERVVLDRLIRDLKVLHD